MKSSLPKVIHPVAHLPMVAHVVKAAHGSDIALVVGRQAELVRDAVHPFAPEAEVFLQSERLGTAHAVLAAREKIARGYDDILVMFGDTPLVESNALNELRNGLANGADIVVMGFVTSNPTGYGRLIEKDGSLVAIREEKDATDQERAIQFCNGGLMAISGEHALSLLDAVGNDNAKGEYYLTDIVEIATKSGLRVTATTAPYENVLGINTRAELAEAEAIWQQRRRRHFMLAGVSMAAPETVFLAHDTEISEDVLLEPNIVFGVGAKVLAGARIRAFSHIEGATIREGAEIGPFARLRPGTDVGKKAKVGNFCEVKNAILDEGAKVNHLTYIGDASIGSKANIGAGTITCNYDGYNKSRTEIGAGAFIGSNSSLVAPIKIGAGGYVASGSVVTQDVPDDAVAFGRSRQENKLGLARRLRERLSKLRK